MATKLPHVDPRTQTELTPEQIKFWEDKGFLVIRNALCAEELEALRKDTKELIDGAPEKRGDPDYWFNDEIPENWYKSYSAEEPAEKKTTTDTTDSVKRGVSFRIEYPIEKSNACKKLMGHSFVLRAMEQLLGASFIPTWDSMVYKYPGEGVPIKWHRDASAASVDHVPAIDVGFYLDEANTTFDNCLYVIPGSHKWDDQFAAHMLQFLSSDGFRKTSAVPVPVQPGDVIMHNILVLHGSPACNSPLRRTVYYEYRSIPQELAMGPHKPEYIPLKQKLLLTCLDARKGSSYDEKINQKAFEYRPDAQYANDFDPQKDEKLSTLRFPHKDYFRSDYKG